MAFKEEIVIGSKADLRGFKQAEGAAEKLGKSVKSLAATLGIAFSVAAIVNYGKAAVKAAADDSKAQAVLANNLKNVGLAYAQMPVEQFISNMQKQTGILDDQLRPAFARLAQVTGSVQKSQDLMASAFDISSGSGVDFSTVVETLSQAYIGNNKGLKKLGINMTQAELKTASFFEIMTQLNKQFTGAGKAALATYGGQMDLLTAAAKNAQETIGFALLDALKSISGSTDVSTLTTGIDNLAEATSLFIKLLAKPLDDKGSWVNKLGDLITKLPGFASTVKVLADYLGVQDIKTGYGQQSPGERNKAVAAEALALKRNKALTAELRKQALAAAALAKSKKEQQALDKATAAAQLALGKGTDIFDMDKIQLNAALIGQAEALGKATTAAQVLAIANDVQRLKIKQDILELEDAISSKDVKRIESATAQLNKDLAILGTLQNQNIQLLGMQSILDGITPVDLINQANLDEALRKIYEMMKLLAGMSTTGATGAGGTTTKKIIGTTVPEFKDLPVLEKLTGKESMDAILEYSASVTELANVMADMQDAQNALASKSLNESILTKIAAAVAAATLEANKERYGNAGGGPVVTIIDKTSGLIEVVQTAVQENNRFGNNLSYAGAI